MPFTKEHPGKGRLKGSHNSLDGSLRVLLKDVFHKNKKIVEQRLSRMLEETSDLEDFKWALELKVKLEPKEVQLSGAEGEPLKLAPPQIIIIKHEAPPINNSAKPIDVTVNRVTETLKCEN